MEEFIVQPNPEQISAFKAFMKALKIKFEPLKKEKVSPYKKEVLEGLKEAVEQVNLHKQGKIQLRSAEELIDEL